MGYELPHKRRGIKKATSTCWEGTAAIGCAAERKVLRTSLTYVRKALLYENPLLIPSSYGVDKWQLNVSYLIFAVYT